MPSKVCPFCVSEVGRATSFTCSGCKSIYHKDCASEAGACVVIGCRLASNSQDRSTQAKSAASITNTSQKQTPAGEKNNTPEFSLTVSKFFSDEKFSSFKQPIVGASIGVALLVGGWIGYASGNTSGYDRGYAAGSAGGYSTGYSAGYSAGCEHVFEDAGYFEYLTAYDPYNPWNRYPGSNYIAKSNCR